MQPVLNPRYSLVIPVYRNSENIGDLVPACRALHDALAGRLEVIFVVDGSPDDSHARLAALLPSSGLRAQLISLSRNFGSFAAIREGLLHARGAFAAVMAAGEPTALAEQLSGGPGAALAPKCLASGQRLVRLGQLLRSLT